MTERAFVVIGGLALALVCLLVLVVLAEWFQAWRRRREQQVRARKDPDLFRDFHRAERHAQMRRLSEDARTRLEQATKTGTRH